MTFVRPENVEDALLQLSRSRWQILAGGTDFFPGLRDRPADGPIMDITGLQDLSRIREDQNFWRIGANATWSDLMTADLPRAFDGLKLAAREVGSLQIQNRATVVGNICNASPAADGVPPLLTLDAEVELASTNGVRRVCLSDFIVGNRVTLRGADELVTAVLVPKEAAAGQSSFLKLGARRYLVISIAMIACRLVSDSANRLSAVAVSVGACSAVAVRLRALEERLTGRPLTEDLASQIKLSDFSDLAPIDDVRSTASYRLAAGRALLARALAMAVQECRA